jgi:capsular polysaccharide transport system permease protein
MAEDVAFSGFEPDTNVQTGLVGALRLQFRVIGALMLREAMARYGRENLGFFWLVFEPLILSTGVMVIWTLSGGHGQSGAAGLAPMALSGYATLTFFRHVVGRSVHRFRYSAPLLFHRKIRLIDCLLATVLLESCSVLTSFLIAYFALYLFDLVTPIHDPLVMFGAWALWTWYLFSIALVLASLTELVEWIEHFVQPIMYFLLPISGTFFILDWIPDKYRHYLYWVPQIQMNEMFRSSFFPPELTFYWNPWYLIVPSIVWMAIGLYLYDFAKLAIRYE